MTKPTKSQRSKNALAQSPSHMIHRALQLALDIYTEEAATSGLTQRQFAVLEVTAQQTGLTQTDLVKATGIDRSTLADIVARLEAKGLLETERSVLDARAKVVRLSVEGQATLDATRPCVEAADKRILQLVPKAKRENFLEILTHLAQTADAVPEEAKSEAKIAKKAAKEARKADKLARKSETGEAPVKKAKKRAKAQGEHTP